MGLSIESTKFVMECWKAGVRFDQTLTLGRQSLFPSVQRLEAILKEFGAWPPAQGVDPFRRELTGSNWKFETFARALGARSVASCDASNYEGATLVHDLNQPIAKEWEERFDVVLDGGTLEHVFNFPVAISNCMKMLKIGGHLILFTPTNNYCGHGFYQFSPELFYRVLSPDNGFEMERMVALEDNLGCSSIFGARYVFPIAGPWHEVRDPAKIGERVTLMNHNSSILMVLAKKVSNQPIFKNTPQQSDYVPQWQQGRAGPGLAGQTQSGERILAWLQSRLPDSVCRELLPRLAVLADPFRVFRFRRENSFANRKRYQRVRT